MKRIGKIIDREKLNYAERNEERQRFKATKTQEEAKGDHEMAIETESD